MIMKKRVLRYRKCLMWCQIIGTYLCLEIMCVYRIEDKYIRIINLYHEKQDFMWQLFGIDTTPQDMMDYWDE